MVRQQEYSRYQEQQLVVLRRIAEILEKLNCNLEKIAIRIEERTK